MTQNYEPLAVSILKLSDIAVSTATILWIARTYHLHNKIELLAVVFLTIFVVYSLVGVYKAWRIYRFRNDIFSIILSNCIVFSILQIFSYICTVDTLITPRINLILCSVYTLGTITTHSIMYILLTINRNHKLIIRKAVICGISNASVQLIKWISNNIWYMTEITGIFDQKKLVQSMYGIPVRGKPDDLPQYIKNHSVDVVYIALSSYDDIYVQKILEMLFDCPCSVAFATDLSTINYFHNYKVQFCGDLPVTSIVESPLSEISTVLKRLEDIVLSIIFLIIASPVMLIAAALIKFTTPGSVIFKQWRYGYKGKPFQVWKFRTMSVSEDGYTYEQAKGYDARITKFGHILRKTSIDELPQFFNVLFGSMSIVGPRPHAVAMVDNYRSQVSGSMLRHLIKPGVTGVAQLYGTRETVKNINQVHQRILYDIDYIRHWSILLDLKIIWKTVISIITRNKRVV